MCIRDRIYTICAYLEDKVTLESQIEELFSRCADTDEIIVATDIFGGSVNNEFLARIRKQNFWLVSGMNLPMIVQLTICLLYTSKIVPEEKHGV